MTVDRMAAMNARRYGFAWGQVFVTRLAEVKRRATDKEPYRVLSVNDLTIYVSPSGRTRVFKNHEELKPDATARERRRDHHKASGGDEPHHAGGHDGQLGEEAQGHQGHDDPEAG